MSPWLSSTILNSQYFRHTKKEDRLSGRVFGVPMTSPQSQQQPTPAHLSLHRSQDHSPNITVWTPTPYKPHLAPFNMLSSSQAWLHRLELNISNLTKGSRAPGATIFSQLGAPSRHVGTGPGAGTAARTGSAPEFYSAQQAILLLQLPTADSDTRDLLKKFVKQFNMRSRRFVKSGQVR